MRIFRRVMLVSIILIATILIAAPPIIGLVFQNAVDMKMSFLGLQKKADVKVISYHRGWFSSDVVSSIKFMDADVRAVLQQLGVASENIPEPLELVFVQHIQHGPVFYVKKKALTWFGLIAIDRKLQVAPNQEKLFAKFGITDSLVRIDQTLLSLTGKCLTHINIGNYYFTFPNGIRAGFSSLQSNVWLSSFAPRVKGDVTVNTLTLDDEAMSVLLPYGNIQFDLQKDRQGLWIGSQSLSLSEIVARDEDSQLFALNDIQINGLTDESAGLIDVRKKVSLKKMQLDSQQLGPFYLQVSINRLNAQAIANVIEAYQEISQQGELYESQLHQKMLDLLPDVIAPGASIQLDKLNVTTPSGQLQLSGKVAWPRKNFSQDNSVTDLVQAAAVQASVRLSTQLANDIIMLMAKMSYLYQIPPEEREVLMDVQDEVRFLKQQNQAVIRTFVVSGQLSKEDGAYLLAMIRQNVSLEDFASEVKKLFLTRRIPREQTYLLDWQYSALNDQATILQARLQRFQDAVAEQIHAQLDAFVKLGYIVQEQGDYVLRMKRENGVMQLGGREIK